MVQMFCYMLQYIFFINLPVEISIYLLIYSFIHSSQTTEGKDSMKSPGALSISMLFEFFIGFTDFFFVLESEAYASCQENNICHS